MFCKEMTSPQINSRHSLCVQNHLLDVDSKKAPAPRWDTIRYMVAVVQYGGRITDEYDKLLMDTLAEKYFQQVAALWYADIELSLTSCGFASREVQPAGTESS